MILQQVSDVSRDNMRTDDYGRNLLSYKEFGESNVFRDVTILCQ